MSEATGKCRTALIKVPRPGCTFSSVCRGFSIDAVQLIALSAGNHVRLGVLLTGQDILCGHINRSWILSKVHYGLFAVDDIVANM